MGIITLKRGSKRLHIHNIEVRLTQKLNNHAKAFVTGMLYSEIENSYLESTTANSEFTVEYEEEGADSEVLFTGLCLAMRNESEGLGENAVYYVEVELIAFTYLMDIQKVRRSFQNHQMSYDDLLAAINRDQNASVHGSVASGAQTGAFILQYDETNWEFLKRMLSKFKGVLIGDYIHNRPRYKFGLVGTANHGDIEEYTYTITRDFTAFRSVTKNQQLSHVSDRDYRIFTVTVEGDEPEIFSAGDRMTVKNQKLHIEEVETIIKDYRFLTTYTLKTAQGLRQVPYNNSQIVGVSLIGTVIDVADNVLKVHLHLDDDQDVGEATWFRYATLYSNWYCMPEKGDLVNLYLPSEKESQAIVINSIKNLA